MAKQKKTLFKMIETFLEDRRKSDRGGWAEVTKDDMDQFHLILNALLEMKFELDASSELPIDLHVIDRTKFWPSHYFAIPYTMSEDEEGMADYRDRMLRAFDLLLSNLHTASEAVRNFTGHPRDEGVEANIRREVALQRVKPLETGDD